MECSYRQRPWAVTREARDGRDPKFEVQGSKFPKPRTSDLEPSLVPHVSRGGFRILLIQLTGDGVGLKAASCR